MSSSHSSGSSGGRVSGAWPHPVTAGAALTPKNLLRHHKLPTAAHLHTPTAPPGLDLSRPLLLYTSYNSTKVRGVSLRPGREGGLTPVGPAIVIPESYTGWFAIVTSDGHTAPFFSTVEQVATSQVSFFLTRYDVPAYTNLHDENGRVTYQKTVVQSGHVLKLLGIFEDLNAKKTNSGGRGRDAMSVFNCNKYAQCLNYRNEVVFLPFSASGRFYTTAHKTSKNPNHVYLMAHILKNHKLPLTVRLVCGYMPRVPCSFTGVLRLEQSQKEAVILACTMTNEAQATLFEIDVSSNFVLTPVKDPVFPKTPIFLKTVSYCEDEADAWRRQIKVTHHVTEKRSKSLCRTVSEQPRPVSFALLTDHDRKKVRGRDKSRDRLAGLRIGDRSREKSKENILRNRSRDRLLVDRNKDWFLDRNKEKHLDKTKDKLEDNGKDRLQGKSSNKLSEKGQQDQRKLSKQNTYIFQNGRSTKVQEKKQEADAISRLNKSIENLDYSRVVDDISPVQEDEDGEEHYAEICEYFMNKNGVSSKKDNNKREKRKSTGDRDHNVHDPQCSDHDNNLSFTLLKKDIGGYYVKIPGFEVPRADFEPGTNSDPNRSYDSLC
ncbi:uncharacterized protein LOC121874050 [Homarus americanus]|uniref:GRB2-associated and regulator of MAPK protein 1-like n=1 Tax=Homarus americanus TaxID=6706 RepID=A0A8J5JQJ7_HOMAM|nr:uncharacterized protein LOC121874050 [Homarus americanus]KAG7162270.1 GRB2-associated and regulator of MAPK protein 1-like [Homarus americanus]